MANSRFSVRMNTTRPIREPLQRDLFGGVVYTRGGLNDAEKRVLQAGGTYRQLCRGDGEIPVNWKYEMPPELSVKTTGEGWQSRLVDEMGERHSAVDYRNRLETELTYRKEICEWDEKRPTYLPVDGTNCERLRNLEYDLASEAFLRSKFAY